MSNASVVRSEIIGTFFGLYTDKDIKNRLSCCHITQSQSFDANNNPTRNGLYDRRMGPVEHSQYCETCGLNYVNCPGHAGHIELDVPVYYPMLFPSMFQILRSKCMYCHKLRMSEMKARFYHIKLKLIEMGDLQAADTLYDLLQPSVVFEEETTKEKADKKRMNVVSPEVEQKLAQYERKYDMFKKSARAQNKTVDPQINDKMRATVTEFQKGAVACKSCENCGGPAWSFRKDGFSKIFQKPLSAKTRKALVGSNLRYRTALEEINKEGGKGGGREHISDDSDDDYPREDDSDEHSTDEEEGSSSGSDDGAAARGGDASRSAEDKGAKDADKYLVPIEVEAQIKLLWQSSAREVLNYVWRRVIYSRAENPESTLDESETWRVFFTRVVLVPPNKFRPAAKVGDMTSEHPQNVHLSRIMEHNMRIRLLQSNIDPNSVINHRPPGVAATAAAAIAIASEKMDVEEALKTPVGKTKGKKSVTINEALNTTSSSPTPTPAKQQPEQAMELSKLVTVWIDLQNSVNCYMDSAKDPNPLGTKAAPTGIRQLLERKEGLFRRHMMGKRVNYCCRSVISPDPYLGTNEIGIPVHFAKTLHFPTPVNDWNVKYLRTLVERGPFEYPGANQIETADGRIFKLEKLSAQERAGKAKLLLATPGNKVYRHLIDGDMLLVNRQPTLHKPGIMAHRARVLKHVKEQTLRMNYANCNTYNADFDGDEMNCHFVQSELARAEASFICNTDNQYIVPTSGNPLRGLIQDHVAGGVVLTCKDTFLTRAQFQQLLYIAVSGLPGTEIVSPMEEMYMPQPTIFKPRPLWTGKQVISSLIKHMCRPPLPPLHLDSKSRTPATAFGVDQNEHEVIFRHGELLCGVLDKAAIGNASLGIVHAVYELYGPELAARILNAFGRLFTYVLQDAGHSCGIQDLTLNKTAERGRKELLEKVSVRAEIGINAFLDNAANANASTSSAANSNQPIDKAALKHKVASFLTGDRKNAKAKLDSAMQQVVNESASEVIKVCLPNGLQRDFLRNHFSLMVMTGAKGSVVNQSQISCFLGQQALEGMRVPVMVSGKSLPSFPPFDPSARAGGFVRDRFLTGVKPQEYYFHCMAGREGLVDTAVKTSRSGYLQRCLVKHLEELRIHYDMTVRDSAGQVVQFLYGEDGLDPVNAALLGGKNNQMQFLARNHQAFVHKFSLHSEFFNQGLELESSMRYQQLLSKAKELYAKCGSNPANLKKHLEKGVVVMARKRKDPDQAWSKTNLSSTWYPAEVLKVKHEDEINLQFFDGTVEKKVPLVLMVKPRISAGGGPQSVQSKRLPVPLIKAGLPDTIMNTLPLGSTVGACSEKIQDAINAYTSKNPDSVITETSTESTVKADAFELLAWVKYMRSLACPGEAVGCVAAQSVGEPSTQMTLNTFHLAGHGGANVTLGIPRLREIIMTASKALKTPTMTVPMAADKDMISAQALARKLSRLPLSALLRHEGGVEVGEHINRASFGSRWERKYRIRLLFESATAIKQAFGISFDTIVHSVKQQFTMKLNRLIKMEQRRAGEKTSGENDPLKQFKSKVSDTPSSNRFGRGGGGGEDGDDGRDDGEEKRGRKDEDDDERGGRGADDSDEDEEEEEGDSDDEKEKEMIGYKDDDGSASENSGDDQHADEGSDSSDDEGAAGKKAVSKDKKSVSMMEVDDDTPLSALTKGAVPSRPQTKAATPSKELKEKWRENVKAQKKSMDMSTDGFQYNEAEGWIEIQVSLPAISRRLLMAQIAEKATVTTMVRATKDIVNAYAVKNGATGAAVQTEGVNFEAIWSLPETLIDANQIKSNDIWAILQTYGVEAARQSIVGEISAVFAVYGIDVNPRHLSLIADFMTRNGSYSAMNRIGMMECPSPFLQMSFETTCNFLMKAAQEGAMDNQESPSSRIVLGSVTKIGTGCFDLMIPLQTNNVKSEI